jgi:hypothetical protein
LRKIGRKDKGRKEGERIEKERGMKKGEKLA